METVWPFVQFVLLRDAVWNFFLNGFCVNLVRPLVVLVPLLVIFGGVGRAMGVPQLFRREAAWDRFWIGMGVGVVIWQAVLAGYLFEEFATNYTVDRPPFCERRPITPGLWGYEGATFDVPDGATGPAVRYRVVPAEMRSILVYGLNVMVGAVAFALAVWVAFKLFRGLLWLIDRGRKRVPTARPVRPVSRLPGVLPLVVGIVVGLGVMAGTAWLLLPGTFVSSVDDLPVHQRWVAEAGRAGVEFAGYGNAAGRGAAWEKIEDGKADPTKAGELDAVRTAARDGTRAGLAHYYPVYGLFAVGFGVVILVTAWLIWDPLHRVFQYRRRIFSPAAGLIFLLHLALLVQTVTDYFIPFPQMVYLGMAVLTLVFARAYKLSHPHVLPRGTPLRNLEQHYAEVEAEYQRRLAATATPMAALPATTAPPPGKRLLHTRDIQGWPEGGKKPLVLVCVSGGGSRSAAWTVKVLTELERRIAAKGGPAFPYHVRLVCGASGGILGAAYYVTTLTGPTDTGHLPADREKCRTEINRTIRDDFLTPVVHALVSRDLPGLFLPRLLPGLANYDRGRALEWAWERMLHGGLTQTFDTLLPDEQAGWRPSLVFSPMMVEDGRQLLVSNLDLLDVVHNRGQELLSREAVEFFRLFPDATDFRVGTAARMSATFPYILPAVPLPTDPRRRVVDAGYFDNYGVGLAASWLFNHLDWVEQRVSKVAIVQIRDGLSAADRLMTRPTDPPVGVGDLGTEWLTGPAAGLYAARVSSNAFRNDNMLHLLHQRIQQRFGGKLPFVTPAFEFPAGEDVSLNYCLTRAEGELIDLCLPEVPPPDNTETAKAVRELHGRVNEFVEWFVL